MAIEVECATDMGVRFIRTPEYVWFAEFAQTCGYYRYIGVCHGPAGVGKTWAARYFSRWEVTKQLVLQSYGQLTVRVTRPADELARAVYYTAPVTNTPRRLRDDLGVQFEVFNEGCRLNGRFPEGDKLVVPPLLLIDEADRLTVNSLEYLRDLYDGHQFGLVLIGMPGLEKRLKRYAQLYSRVGFAHAFRPLTTSDLKSLLTERTADGQMPFEHLPFADDEALGAIIRTCRGNLRLLTRLLDQIERLAALNQLSTVTTPVVIVATSLLSIGAPE